MVYQIMVVNLTGDVQTLLKKHYFFRRNWVVNIHLQMTVGFVSTVMTFLVIFFKPRTASTLQKKLKTYMYNYDTMSFSEVLEWNVILTANKLLKHFKEDRAILLPELYREFTTTIESTVLQIPTPVRYSIPTSKRLLSVISQYFHLEWYAKIKGLLSNQ